LALPESEQSSLLAYLLLYSCGKQRSIHFFVILPSLILSCSISFIFAQI